MDPQPAPHQPVEDVAEVDLEEVHDEVMEEVEHQDVAMAAVANMHPVALNVMVAAGAVAVAQHQALAFELDPAAELRRVQARLQVERRLNAHDVRVRCTRACTTRGHTSRCRDGNV